MNTDRKRIKNFRNSFFINSLMFFKFLIVLHLNQSIKHFVIPFASQFWRAWNKKFCYFLPRSTPWIHTERVIESCYKSEINKKTSSRLLQDRDFYALLTWPNRNKLVLEAVNILCNTVQKELSAIHWIVFERINLK